MCIRDSPYTCKVLYVTIYRKLTKAVLIWRIVNLFRPYWQWKHLSDSLVKYCFTNRIIWANYKNTSTASYRWPVPRGRYDEHRRGSTSSPVLTMPHQKCIYALMFIAYSVIRVTGGFADNTWTYPNKFRGTRALVIKMWVTVKDSTT